MPFARAFLPYAPLMVLVSLILMIAGALGYFHQSLSSPTLFYIGSGLLVLSGLLWVLGTLCEAKEKKRKPIGLLLSLMAILMFGFTYALIPFYDVLCNHLDINGKVRALPMNRPQVERHQKAPQTSGMMLNTLVTAHGGIPVVIRDRDIHQAMTPGNPVTPTFTLTNVSDRTLHLRIKMSITPSKAGHFLSIKEGVNQSIIELKPFAKKHIDIPCTLKSDAPKSMRRVALGIGLFHATTKDPS